VWRRRLCLDCLKQFTTTELINLGLIVKVANSANKKSSYNKARILTSLLKACDHRPKQEDDSLYLLETIEQSLLRASSATEQIITTKQIREAALKILNRFDKVAAVKYKSYYPS
jgi:transcriptional regulator NrdR family protein